MKLHDLYYGWLIELTPVSKGYVFKCWMPDQQIGISNYQIYPSLSQAIRAARKRAKLESVRLSLIHFLNESYQECNLTAHEHSSLLNSIFEYISASNQSKINDSFS
jgi:hypothetical protein